MIKRVSYYLKEMFPPYMIFVTIILVFSSWSMISGIHNLPLKIDINMLNTGLIFFLLLLLIRIMDEFKDYEDDKINFPDRPLPSGKVFKKDLIILSGFCLAIPLIFSLKNKEVMLGVGLCIGFSFLMLKWFFLEEKMRKSLILAFISHHPIVFLYNLFLILSFPDLSKIDIWRSFIFLIPLGLLSTNWEFSRKLRAPEDEDTYTTYSKLWGTKTAIMVALGVQYILTCGLGYYLYEIKKNIILLVCLIIILLISQIPYFSLAFGKKLKISLKSCSEIFSLCAYLTISLAHFF